MCGWFLKAEKSDIDELPGDGSVQGPQTTAVEFFIGSVQAVDCLSSPLNTICDTPISAPELRHL